MKKIIVISAFFLSYLQIFCNNENTGKWSHAAYDVLIFESTDNPIIRGQYYNRPTSGYGQDTIIGYTTINNGTGQAGFIAISGNDTAYYKVVNGIGMVLMQNNDSIIFDNITNSDTLAYYLLQTDTIHAYNFIADTLSYYRQLIDTINTYNHISDTLGYYRQLVDTIYTYNFIADTLSYYRQLVDTIYTYNFIADTLSYYLLQTDTIHAYNFVADTLAYYLLQTDTIHAYNFVADTLAYYKTTTGIAAEQWTFSASEIEITNTLTVSAIEAQSVTTANFFHDPPHGYMNFADSSLTIDLAQNTWSDITNPTNTLFTIFEENRLNLQGDSVIFLVHGHYTVHFQLSFTGTPSDDFETRIYSNNSTQNSKGYVSTSTASDFVSIDIFTYIEADPDDFIHFQIRNTASNDDCVIADANVLIVLIHR